MTRRNFVKAGAMGVAAVAGAGLWGCGKKTGDPEHGAVFAKNGADTISWAVALARGYRKRDKIALAHGAYHGTQPWAGTNPIGFLPSDRADVIMVPWGDPDAFGRVVEENIIRLDFLLGSVFPV